MKRISWLDTFKYFCIIAVIAEHTACMTGITDAINSSFYLSGFFFASGYIYNYKDNFISFFKKKVRQLFIPWLFFSLFIVISSSIFSFSDHGDLRQNIINNFMQIRGQGDEMWFVAALFVSFIPFYFLIKWVNSSPATKEKKLLISLFIIFIISIPFFIIDETYMLNGKQYHYFWHIEHIPTGVLFLLLGYCYRNLWENKFDSFFCDFKKIILWIIYLFVVLIPQFYHISFGGIAYIIYHYISILFGLCSFIVLSKSINTNRYISFVGRNTLIYYGLHGKVNSLIHLILFNLVREPYWALCWSYTDSTKLLLEATILSYILALINSFLLIVPTYIINMYIPFNSNVHKSTFGRCQN